jgi:hypothetical protein
VIHLAADVAVWTLALVLATWLRYEFTLEFVSRRDLLVLAGVIAVVHTVFGWSIGVYRRRWRYGSFDEAIAVAAAFRRDRLGRHRIRLHCGWSDSSLGSGDRHRTGWVARRRWAVRVATLEQPA